MRSTACQAKKPMNSAAISSANSSVSHLVRPVSRSVSRPTRIISPDLKVWASPRNAIAAMHHDAMSSPDLTLMPISRPTDSAIIIRKMAIRNSPAR